MTEFFRKPTEEEQKDFKPIGRKTSLELLKAKIAEEEQKALKEGLPFATQVLEMEFKDKLDDWEKKWKRLGYAEDKKPTFENIDVKRYKDLNNFELLEEDEKYDEVLSKRHQAHIVIKFKKYKFKGYSNTYTVMESAEEAIQRAKGEKVKK